MSNRKPFNDRAGYVASKKNKLTNIHNVIYIASEQGVDADGKYITVCEAHGQMVSSTSIPKARVDMKDASQWCSECQALVPEESRRSETDTHWEERREIERDYVVDYSSVLPRWQ